MKHLPWKLLAAAIALGIIFDILFYSVDELGINLFIMELIFLAISIGFALHLRIRLPAYSWVSGSYALAFAATFAVWTSSISLTLSGLGFLTANVLFALSVFGHHSKFRHPLQIISASFQHGFGDVLSRFSILGNIKIPGIKSTSRPIVRGVAIAVPIIIIFMALFVSSDLILQQSTSGIINWIEGLVESGDFIGHIFIITLFSAMFLLFLATAFWRRIEFPAIPFLSARHGTESAIILASTSVLFLGFILFQGVYLFGGQAAWNGIEGITYSEYAVSGFNELAVVSFLVLALILTLRHFHLEKVSKLIRVFESVLIAETILILISAWIRMDLYIDIYAYTPARLFGFWFFMVAGTVLIMLTVNILRTKDQSLFIKNALLVVGAAIFIFTASSPDALSVR
ncbi:MAG: DUF4173 domain-containing protein, partial [bacterium]